MIKFLFTLLCTLALVINTSAAQALTITLNGVTGRSCPYERVVTGIDGNITVFCQPEWTGVGIASIPKGFGNSCTYIGVVVQNNGNIQATCSGMPPAIPMVPNIPASARNLGVYVDKNGMWAWVRPPNGV